MIQIFRICRHGKVPYRRFNSPEASAHVQVQRKYGWELSNRVCRARGAAAHACAPGLSTGRRLMPMPARCGAAAPCRGAATVRRSPHEESTAASAAGKRLSVWSAQSSCNCSDHQTFACLCMRGRGRKLVAIQTEAHACQEQSLAVCRAGSVSATPLAQPPKSECECSAAKRRWCRTFLAIVLASSSNMTRARSADRNGARPARAPPRQT